mgnify:CR=1 FL=1
MVNILGIKFKTTGKTLHAPENEAVLAYTKAVRDGEKQARKILKYI